MEMQIAIKQNEKKRKSFQKKEDLIRILNFIPVMVTQILVNIPVAQIFLESSGNTWAMSDE